MRVRTFEPEDQRSAHDLIQAGLRERWGDSFDPAANPDTNDISASYMTGGSQFVVAESDDGVVIGTGALVPERYGVARIRRMSVDHRFRRRGIAKALVAELLERATLAGNQRVVVSTDTPWSEAVALYQSTGFAMIARDRTDTHFSMDIMPGSP